MTFLTTIAQKIARTPFLFFSNSLWQKLGLLSARAVKLLSFCNLNIFINVYMEWSLFHLFGKLTNFWYLLIKLLAAIMKKHSFKFFLSFSWPILFINHFFLSARHFIDVKNSKLCKKNSSFTYFGKLLNLWN